MSNTAKPKVEIVNEPTSVTPTQAVIAKNQETFTVEYGGCHKLEVCRPNIIARHYFFTYFGENANNQIFMNIMTPLLYVKSIDGVPVDPITCESDAKALLQQLGDDGKDALDKCFLENYVLSQMQKLDVDEDVKKLLLAKI
jgi:hypothetical protein